MFVDPVQDKSTNNVISFSNKYKQKFLDLTNKTFSLPFLQQQHQQAVPASSACWECWHCLLLHCLQWSPGSSTGAEQAAEQQYEPNRDLYG